MNEVTKLLIDKLFKRLYANKEMREEFNKQIKVFYNKSLNDIIFVSLICDKRNVFWYKRNDEDVLGYKYSDDHSQELENFLFKNDSILVDVNIIISSNEDNIFVKKLYKNIYTLNIIRFNKITNGLKQVSIHELDVSNVSATILIGEVGIFVEHENKEYLFISDPLSNQINSFRNVGIVLMFMYDKDTNTYRSPIILEPEMRNLKNNLHFGSNISINEGGSKLLVTMNSLSNFIQTLDIP